MSVAESSLTKECSVRDRSADMVVSVWLPSPDQGADSNTAHCLVSYMGIFSYTDWNGWKATIPSSCKGCPRWPSSGSGSGAWYITSPAEVNAMKVKCSSSNVNNRSRCNRSSSTSLYMEPSQSKGDRIMMARYIRRVSRDILIRDVQQHLFINSGSLGYPWMNFQSHSL